MIINMATSDIIYHNVGGSMNVVTELLKLTIQHNPKIIAIAECPLENNDWLHIDSFTCYAETEATKYGCAVYIRNELVHMFVVERITSQYITLWTTGMEITFAYQRPKTNTFDPDNNWHRGSDNMVIGDLNAKHQDWSAGTNNTAGNRLRDWMRRRSLQVNNPHVITHPTSGSHPIGTTLDLVISDQNNPINVQHLSVPSGDHLALAIRTKVAWRNSAEGPLRYDKANWAMIRAELLLLDGKEDDPAKVQANLTEIVLRHTPRARLNAKGFWCRGLGVERKKLKQMIKENPMDPDIPRARRDYRKAIAEAKLTANGRAL